MRKASVFVHKVVRDWCVRCFGEEHTADPKARGLRLVEEAIEAAQAVQVDKDQIHKLVDYVYARPEGEAHQEIGGVAITLIAFANSVHEDTVECTESELIRILHIPPEKFKARNSAKNEAGFAPQ